MLPNTKKPANTVIIGIYGLWQLAFYQFTVTFPIMIAVFEPCQIKIKKPWIYQGFLLVRLTGLEPVPYSDTPLKRRSAQ